MYSKLISLAVLLAHAIAAPTCPSIQQDANFDDLGLTQFPIPAGYRGLSFPGFGEAFQPATGVVPGIIPHSPSHIAYTNSVTQTSGGTAMLTTNYPNTNTTSFTLQDLYFACSVSLQNSVADVPEACIVSVAGYRGNDNQVSASNRVCAAQYQYNPSTTVGDAEMAFTGAINGCTDIQFVIFSVAPVGSASALSSDTALILDSIRFTSKGC